MTSRLNLVMSTLLLSGAVLCACACAGENAGPRADLPQGWEQATLIEDFHQSACNGSPYDGTPEAMTASANENSVHIAYEPAHFRCAQTVQGFVKKGAGTVDVLVQPVDMNPASVAKCDCLYGLDMNVPADSGGYSITVYRRWDHKSGADSPLQIRSETLVIP
jgi:uncharacterized protein involved in high-affinity Fe2+ transport